MPRGARSESPHPRVQVHAVVTRAERSPQDATLCMQRPHGTQQAQGGGHSTRAPHFGQALQVESAVLSMLLDGAARWQTRTIRHCWHAAELGLIMIMCVYCCWLGVARRLIGVLLRAARTHEQSVRLRWTADGVIYRSG